jgi:hypothetical protein
MSVSLFFIFVQLLWKKWKKWLKQGFKDFFAETKKMFLMEDPPSSPVHPSPPSLPMTSCLILFRSILSSCTLSCMYVCSECFHLSSSCFSLHSSSPCIGNVFVSLRKKVISWNSALFNIEIHPLFPRDARSFLLQHTKTGKIIPKGPQIAPNDYKMYEIAVK